MIRPCILVACWITLASPPGHGAPLVDCSKKEFQRPSSARSLYLWSLRGEKEIARSKSQGVYDERGCKHTLSQRGSAHCKEPGNEEYSAGLARLLKLCEEAKSPPKAEQGTLVDCKATRFQKPQVEISLLLRWADKSLGALSKLRPHEAFRIKPNCTSALDHAGAAHCKDPNQAEARAAVERVKSRCAEVRAWFAAAEAQEPAAAKQRAVDAKANRKIVKFPASTFKGGGARAISRAMRTALFANRVAKKPGEVLRVQPMGRWQTGRYRGTRVPFKKITGLVLWHDKDKDGVCRFVSYNFVKDRKRNAWSPLRVQSFCMGCLEGWTRCK